MAALSATAGTSEPGKASQPARLPEAGQRPTARGGAAAVPLGGQQLGTNQASFPGTSSVAR